MLTLLVKDFKLMFGKQKGLARQILKILFSIFFIACFIGIEVFLFVTILKKIGNIHQATTAFVTIFLTIISVVIIFSNLFNAFKLFFNEKDIEQLSVHPVSNSSIIFSKLIFLFLTHYATCFIVAYPIFVAYGQLHFMPIKFYYLGLFYPMVTFLFESGIALLFVYPFYILKKWLKKHLMVKFIFNVIILFVGCYLYSKVLNVFIEIIAGNSFNSLLNDQNIGIIIQLKKYIFPINLLTDVFFAKATTNFLPALCIGLGVFMLGVSICIFAFNYVRNISYSRNNKVKEYTPKTTSVIKSLFKKEITILLKNADYTFSFTTLLLVQPFLALLVIKALNTIFTTGVFSYYISVVPNFIPLMNVLILMLFSTIIAQGANTYIQNEKTTIKLMKTIPVNSTKQLLVKVSIPFLMSFISLLITNLVLLFTGNISFITFIFCLLIVTALLVIFDLISLYEELNIRHHKPRSTFVSNMITYIVPFTYFFVTAVLSYFGLKLILAFIIGLLVVIIIGIPFVIYLKKHIESLFMDLDVIN
ncbi:MAG: hypothetical protein IKC22_02315 [Bacilli bacterium]|nr:hypothetical protein [Bacilli bacterium]